MLLALAQAVALGGGVMPSVISPPASSGEPLAFPEPEPDTVTPARRAPNVVFAEVLGNGLLYTINYERIIESWHVGLRVGLSAFSYPASSHGGSSNVTLLSLPVVASYYVGWPQHKLQLGVGATLLYLEPGSDAQGTRYAGDRSGLGAAATAVIGYRYLPRERGIAFGVGFTPIVRTTQILPWGGISVGYAF